jgi:hypothetical protein
MAANTTSTGAKPKLRWYQYSLRTLVVFVMLCAVACSWLAVKMEQARKQREAVEAIEKLGGVAKYGARPGDCFFANVVDVSFTTATDDGLEHLDRLTYVEFLWLHDSQVTDKGLQYVEGLTQLKWLDLDYTHVTDQGLAHLKGLPNLNTLWLNGTQVTHKGVSELQQALPNCHIIPPF